MMIQSLPTVATVTIPLVLTFCERCTGGARGGSRSPTTNRNLRFLMRIGPRYAGAVRW